MCPDPPPRRSPSRWSEGTVRRSCLGGDSLAQGCTAVEPSREGCWRCPRSVQSPFAAFRRGLRTSHAFGSRGRLGRTDARGAGSLIAGGGAREQTRVRGGVGAILLCHEARPRQYRLRGRAGLRRRVCGAWQVVRLWEAGRCFWLGPLCAVQCRIGHRLSWSERRSGTGATVTLGGDYDRDSEVTVQ